MAFWRPQREFDLRMLQGIIGNTIPLESLFHVIAWELQATV